MLFSWRLFRGLKSGVCDEDPDWVSNDHRIIGEPWPDLEAPLDHSGDDGRCSRSLFSLEGFRIWRGWIPRGSFLEILSPDLTSADRLPAPSPLTMLQAIEIRGKNLFSLRANFG